MINNEKKCFRIFGEVKNGSQKQVVGIQKTPKSEFSISVMEMNELEGGSRGEYSLGAMAREYRSGMNIKEKEKEKRRREEKRREDSSENLLSRIFFLFAFEYLS